MMRLPGVLFVVGRKNSMELCKIHNKPVVLWLDMTPEPYIMPDPKHPGNFIKDPDVPPFKRCIFMFCEDCINGTAVLLTF